MKTRSLLEMKLLHSRDPQPSVEVQPDTLGSAGFDDIAARALDKLARAEPNVHCTVYRYSSPSVNFHQPGWSAFLVVVGDQKSTTAALGAMTEAFSRASPAAKCRMSDYVRPADATELFHLEDGAFWRAEDADTWVTRCDERASAPRVAESPSIVDQVTTTDAANNIAVRRNTRADATVNSVRRQIETAFGLPEGSVALCGPDGRPLRGDALIRTLRLCKNSFRSRQRRSSPPERQPLSLHRSFRC
jgi:hypothetical protein